MSRCSISLRLLTCSLLAAIQASPSSLEPLKQGDARLITDLGVGMWAGPLPLAYNGDGERDLPVNSIPM